MDLNKISLDKLIGCIVSFNYNGHQSDTSGPLRGLPITDYYQGNVYKALVISADYSSVTVILKGQGGFAIYHDVYKNDILSVEAPLTASDLLLEEL